jgi:hypothetical protein
MGGLFAQVSYPGFCVSNSPSCLSITIRHGKGGKTLSIDLQGHLAAILSPATKGGKVSEKRAAVGVLKIGSGSAIRKFPAPSQTGLRLSLQQAVRKGGTKPAADACEEFE